VGADQYSAWATDSNGNYTGNIIGVVSGTSGTLESLETSFHQDLNGDGVIGVPSSTSPAPAVAGAGSAPIQVAGNNGSAAGQDTFVFAPNFGQVTIAHFAPETDTIQISKAAFANIDALLAATHDDAHGDAVVTDAAHDTITIQNVATAQLQAHQGDFHLV